MTLPRLTQAALDSFVRDHADDYAHLGLRIVDDLPPVGEVLPRSRAWDDGNPTDDLLPGTSALRITARTLELAAAYMGDYALLVGSHLCMYGDDPDELVMRDAVVLARFAIG